MDYVTLPGFKSVCYNVDHDNMEKDSGKLLFISFKCKFSEETDAIHNRIVEEFVRTHGNEVHCCCPSDNSTFTQSSQLPFPESKVKKIAIGPSFIGIILQDGKVCRIKYTPNLSKSNGVRPSSQKPDVSFQVESDEAFARSLDERLNRRSSDYSARLNRAGELYPNFRSGLLSSSHGHLRTRPMRGTRRYEPYSLDRPSIRPIRQTFTSNDWPIYQVPPTGISSFPSIGRLRAVGPNSPSDIIDRISQGVFPLSGILQVSIEQSNFPTGSLAEQVTLPGQEDGIISNGQSTANSAATERNGESMERESVINGSETEVNNGQPLLHSTTVLDREAFMPIAEEPIALEATNFGLPAEINPLSTSLDTESQNSDGPSMIQVVENTEATDDDNDSNSLLSDVTRERNDFNFPVSLVSHSRLTPDESSTFQRVETPTLLFNVNEVSMDQTVTENERSTQQIENNIERNNNAPSQLTNFSNHNIISEEATSATGTLSNYQKETSNLSSLFPMLSTMEEQSLLDNQRQNIVNASCSASVASSRTSSGPKVLSSVATASSSSINVASQAPSFTSIVEQQTSLDQLPIGFRPMRQRLGFMKREKDSVSGSDPKRDGEKMVESETSMNFDRWWPSTGEIEWLSMVSALAFDFRYPI